MTITATMPGQFRLGFEYEAPLVAIGSSGARHASQFAALTGSAEFDVPQLLATAALRHFGAPYSSAIAIAKETVLWWSWLGVVSAGTRPLGTLLVPHAQNAGRLAEFSAGVGEALALDLAISLFQIPFALWRRVAETDPQGMDFVAPGPHGDVAIEAKATIGSGVARKKKEITAQKSRRTAAEKYGFVTCYAMAGRKALSQKGSYVRVVDPPGDEDLPPSDRYLALREHYFQIGTVLGLQGLTSLLAPLIGRSPPTALPPRQARNLLEDDRAAGRRVSVGGEVYLGHFFNVDSILGDARGVSVPATSAQRVSFMGLARSVCLALVDEDTRELDRLLQRISGVDLAFVESRLGQRGTISYVGLSDGGLRVDLTSLADALDQDLDW